MRSAEKTRVLLIDDSADFTEMLTLLLTRLDCEVASVGTGAEALAAFQRLRPQLVLLDLGLPDMDGGSVAEQLRHEKSPSLIVALSGFTERGLPSTVPGLFDQRLLKPIDLAALDELVAAARARS